MSRHRFDPVSFVFGVLFAAVAVLGLVGLDRIRVEDLTWAGPVLLLVLGLVALLSAARDPATADADRSVAEGAPVGAVQDPSRSTGDRAVHDGLVGGAGADPRDGEPVDAAAHGGDPDGPDAAEHRMATEEPPDDTDAPRGASND